MIISKNTKNVINETINSMPTICGNTVMCNSHNQVIYLLKRCGELHFNNVNRVAISIDGNMVEYSKEEFKIEYKKCLDYLSVINTNSSDRYNTYRYISFIRNLSFQSVYFNKDRLGCAYFINEAIFDDIINLPEVIQYDYIPFDEYGILFNKDFDEIKFMLTYDKKYYHKII